MKRYQNHWSRSSRTRSDIPPSGNPLLSAVLELYLLKQDGFDLNVDKEMVTVAGRLLTPPRIEYRNNKVSSRNGRWDLRGGTELKTAPKLPLERWGYIAIENANANEPDMGKSLQIGLSNLTKALQHTGLTTRPPQDSKPIKISGPQDVRLEKSVRDAVRRKFAILLVILFEKNTILYNSIKQLADVVCGIPTICVVRGRFIGAKVDYYTNVALKFNLKLGGTNHVLCDPQVEKGKRVAIISENKTMVVGIGVTNPGPGSANPSIAAMVASVDASLAQWPADLRVQIRTRQEMVTPLGDMLKSRLTIWQEHHRGMYPENILIYRDGVSESQYEQVLKDELSLMQKACPSIYAERKQQPPRFTVVIVGKRHHTRFFLPTGSVAGDKSMNPKCGLVVDRGVTEARNWDFFLQSHASPIGTARPTHYYVLWDEIFTSPASSSDPSRLAAADLLEQLTHDMCYLWGRSLKAVSLCPPIYYADIACGRAARYVANRPPDAGSESGRSESEMTEGARERLREDLQGKINVHENLKNTMFYI